MQKVIQLTEQEYNDLLTVRSKPDDMLRQTNAQLKTKLDEYALRLKQATYQNARIDTPFVINDDTLSIRSGTDFVVMYNNTADSILKNSDKAFLLQLKRIAEIFNLTPQFTDTKQVKAYRVALTKRGLCSAPAKRNGRDYLKLTPKAN